MRAMIGTELLRKLPIEDGDIRDTKLSGFVLRVRPSGAHSYFINYRRKDTTGETPAGDPIVIWRNVWVRLGTTDKLTAPEAREEARKKLADVWKGRDPQLAKKAVKTAITFQAFVETHYAPWAAQHRKTGAEQAARLRAVFGPTFDATRLDQITAFAVERWRSARLKDGIAKATTNRDLNTLKAALRLAVRWKLLSTYPLADVKAATVDTKGRVRFLTPDEETRLRDALTARDDARRAERERSNLWRRERGYALWPALGTYTDHLTPIVLLALNTGLRRGELFNLRWRDVDLARALLTVEGAGAKSAQTRHVPLNTEALDVLRTWAGETTPDPAAYVFPGLDGDRLEDIKGAWLPLVKAVKVTAFTFHDLRHTFASNLVMAGVDLNTVRELLGHADLKMTLRYSHLAPEHKAAAVAKLVTR